MSTRTFHLLLPSPESLKKHNTISKVSQKDYFGFFFLPCPASPLLVKSVGFLKTKPSDKKCTPDRYRKAADGTETSSNRLLWRRTDVRDPKDALVGSTGETLIIPEGFWLGSRQCNCFLICKPRVFSWWCLHQAADQCPAIDQIIAREFAPVWASLTLPFIFSSTMV